MHKQYDQYKPSGVEWIGKIPMDWEVWKVKHTTYVKGRIGWQALTTAEYCDEGSFLVTGTDFHNGVVDWNTCHHVSLERYNMDRFIQLFEGDVLISKDGSIGKIAIVKNLRGKATLNSGVFVTRPLAKPKYIPKYFYWILTSNVFTTFINYISSGTTIAHLYQNVFIEFQFPTPPLPEQTAIASFLDHKTALIDRIITNRRKQIELLKEERQAVINQAVTKGINKNVKLKPSGIEWLGDIPEHWEVVKLKFLKSKNKNAFVDGPFGSNLKSEHIVDDGDVYVIESGHITTGIFNFKEKWKTITVEHFLTINRSECIKDDIILAKIGANYGMSAILHRLDKPSVISGNALKLTINQEHHNLNFIHYQLLNLKFNGAFELIVNLTAQPALSLITMNNISLAIPPDKNEETKVVAHIEQKTSKIDTLITKYEKQITLLEEYRTALISKAVTGQIDVRDWKPDKELYQKIKWCNSSLN